ncbi:chaplin family protein [Streptomyces enissocaesilis]|uniref:Chaplin domain-containing protein n=1 Tax=Streptomyces enissocaesilis TaxID=332589 RepID=A0ABN3XP24_9ACTN
MFISVTLGALALSAAPAHAGIIGAGNSAFGNSCTTLGGGAQASGSTVAGSGVLGGNLGQLPLNLTRNKCGNSGIICGG